MRIVHVDVHGLYVAATEHGRYSVLYAETVSMQCWVCMVCWEF